MFSIFCSTSLVTYSSLLRNVHSIIVVAFIFAFLILKDKQLRLKKKILLGFNSDYYYYYFHTFDKVIIEIILVYANLLWNIFNKKHEIFGISCLQVNMLVSLSGL